MKKKTFFFIWIVISLVWKPKLLLFIIVADLLCIFVLLVLLGNLTEKKRFVKPKIEQFSRHDADSFSRIVLCVVLYFFIDKHSIVSFIDETGVYTFRIKLKQFIAGF
jgi:hypothetical protein